MSRLNTAAFLQDFLDEAHDLLESVEASVVALAEDTSEDRSPFWERLRRDVHTLKGNAGLVGLNDLQRLFHDLEDELPEAVAAVDAFAPQLLLAEVDRARELLRHAQAAAPEGDDGEGFRDGRDGSPGGVRVRFPALDGLVDRLAEAVVFRNRLRETIGRARKADGTSARDAWRSVSEAETSLSGVLDRLREQVMALRLMPLEPLFVRLRRLVHEEGFERGKRVRAETSGGHVPIDKALWELAAEALGHLVRNAVIHGIESPAERASGGKPEEGTVRISARVEGETLEITVEDDGGGIEEAVRERIFEAGVTSMRQADLGAGRGMGLPAVRAAVRRRGGHLRVSSVLGLGTRFRLTLPLEISVIQALRVRVDDEEYALPLNAVLETCTLNDGDRHEVGGADFLRWREGLLPLLDLGVYLGTGGRSRENGFVVVLQVGDQRRGLAVDALLGLQELVMGSLDPVLGSPPGVAGTTVLGDGRALLILDVADLLQAPTVEEAAA